MNCLDSDQSYAPNELKLFKISLMAFFGNQFWWHCIRVNAIWNVERFWLFSNNYVFIMIMLVMKFSNFKLKRNATVYYSGFWTVDSSSSPSGCQYSMRLDRLHRAYPSLHPSGVVLGHQNSRTIKAVTGSCTLIDGCSLELYSTTPSAISSGISTKNKVNSMAWLYRGPW